MKIKILISSINGPIGYELVKYLKKKFYVIGCDCQPFGLGREICDEFYKSPHGSSKLFLSFLQKMSLKVDQFFLFADEEIYNLSENRNNMSTVIKKTLISPHETIKFCNNKSDLKKYLKNFLYLPKDNANKIIVKPKIGRGSKNQLILNDNSNGYSKFFSKDNNFFVEEFIEGKEYTVDCIFNKDYKLDFLLARERVIKSNISIVGKIVKDSKIIMFIEKLSKKLKFIGNVNIQIIINKQKKIFLTDINPRISGSIIFSIAAGFNPFAMASDILLKKKITKPKEIKYGKTLFRYWKTFQI